MISFEVSEREKDFFFVGVMIRNLKNRWCWVLDRVYVCVRGSSFGGGVIVIYAVSLISVYGWSSSRHNKMFSVEVSERERFFFCDE